MPLSTNPIVVGSHIKIFREDDPINSTIATVSRARSAGNATIVTPTPHGLWTGASVVMSSLADSTFNVGPIAVNVISPTSFTYVNAGTDVTTVADAAGVVTLTGTASAILKPGPIDAGWIDMGEIEALGVSRSSQQIDIWGADPGVITFKDLISIKQKLTFKITCQHWGPYHHEVLMLTQKLDSTSTQYNPLSGSDKKAWMKLQAYNHKNVLFTVLDAWCHFNISGEVQFGGSDLVKPVFDVTMLGSQLRTGTL